MIDIGRDGSLIAFVERFVWTPRRCHFCWRFLWLTRAFVRLRPEYQRIQIMCRSCGARRLV